MACLFLCFEVMLMSHYFENDQNLPSNLKKTTTSILNQNFIFYTDNGVFAKHGLDYGSRLLLESLPYDDLKGPVLDVGESRDRSVALQPAHVGYDLRFGDGGTSRVP